MTVLIDNSTMEAIASCHTRVAMERVLHLKPKASNFFIEAGSAMHKAWEGFFTGADIEECVVALRSYYGEKLPHFENLPESYTLENLEMLFRIWAANFPERKFPWVSQHVEKAFQVRLHPDLDVDLYGKLDTFGAEPSGALCVVDWKTTGKLDFRWLKKWKASSQVSAYTYAMQRIYGAAVWVMYIMGLEIKKVPMSNRKCSLHGMKYWDEEKREGCFEKHINHQVEPAYRTPEQILAWWMDTKLLVLDYLNILDSCKSIDDIHRFPQQGMFNQSCYNCDYHDFCHVFNRRPEAAESLFEVRPWSPVDNMNSEDIFKEA